MKYLNDFNNFDKYQNLNEELNWWQKLLVGGGIVGSMFTPKDVSAQKGEPIKTMHRTVKTQKQSDVLVKQGWQLNSTQIDTIWNDVVISLPDTIVETTTLGDDLGQFFKLGKFELTDETKEGIKQELEEIASNGGLVTGIHIISSTDKVPVTPGLAKKLNGMGLTGDNSGLAKARCNVISEYLESLGVVSGEDGIITIEPLAEQGKDLVTAQEKTEGDPNARKNIVEIEHIIVKQTITPGETERRFKVKTTYDLSKDYKQKTKNIFKGKKSSKISKHGKMKKRKLSLKGVECRMPGR